ncbi:hypothetical protein R3P38DRAFT_3368818 [Favolaschia claudopus]|uniref:Ribosomal protein L5 n=1 Tax=Favolaschia claudopus TaxID=2862362 RepID=A0AAW0A5L2_9AGAR
MSQYRSLIFSGLSSASILSRTSQPSDISPRASCPTSLLLNLHFQSSDISPRASCSTSLLLSLHCQNGRLDRPFSIQKPGLQIRRILSQILPRYATVEALGLDYLYGCVGIQHFDSDSSAQPSTGKATFADLANARKGRQMGKIQFTNNFLTHRVPFMLSPGRSLHIGQKSASNPPVAAPKKIRHATGPLFLPGPQNRRPTNSVSFSPRNPKEFTISKIEVENVSSGFFGLTSDPGYPVLRNRATVAADLNPISTQFKLSTGEIVRR